MKVFYRPEMSSADANSFSPSASKPQQFVDSLLQYKIIEPDDVQSFEPATREQIMLAHDPVYVNGVLDSEIENGFGNVSQGIAKSLPYTTGSLIAACQHAVNEKTVALSPTSGFHHAGHDFGGGFCTFNGLVIAAIALKQAGLVDTVSIIDCDAHYGNGTADIIKRKKLTWIQHHTAGLLYRKTSKGYFTWLQAACRSSEGADLVIYQAGADPHVDDPLGGYLTSKQMFDRDYEVRSSLQDRPMVWNLAGGYQRDPNGSIEPVLKLHRATANIMKDRYFQ